MQLPDFIAKMKNNKYSNEYVEKIDGKTYFYTYFDNAIFDITDYKNDESQITHACLERHINKKVEVINFVRDVREDWGDDGGFCFYVGKYENKFILGSNYISYNGNFSDEFININKLELEDENIEYMFFDTLLEINAFIGKIITKARKLTEEDEDWGYESWDLEEKDFESPFMHKCIRNLGSAFCEYPEKNTDRLFKLTQPEYYKENYSDPVEFIDGWIEKNSLKAIESW
jgi:hypothetical protein